MKILIQYVNKSNVKVNKKISGQIGRGYVVLVGFGHKDSPDSLSGMTNKLLQLRTIPDEEQQINLSIQDIQGDILLIPQFTLYADTSRGHRPSFSKAAKPDIAATLFEQFVELVKKSGLRVEVGKFGAHMQVTLTNNGPITISLEN